MKNKKASNYILTALELIYLIAIMVLYIVFGNNTLLRALLMLACVVGIVVFKIIDAKSGRPEKKPTLLSWIIITFVYIAFGVLILVFDNGSDWAIPASVLIFIVSIANLVRVIWNSRKTNDETNE